MPLVRVKKSITGFEEVGQIHDSKVFGDQLERLVRKGCLEPLEDLQLPAKPPGLDDLHAEVELLTEKIGGVEKERDDWKGKALAASSESEKVSAALRESESMRADLLDQLGKVEKERDEWKGQAMQARPQTDIPSEAKTQAPAVSAGKKK